MKKSFSLFVLLFHALAGISQGQYRYMPLGDSYTICEGIPKKECWPGLLTEHLSKEGLNITLVGNPSRTGFTTQDLIDIELPVFRAGHISFVTVMIGVNDWVQGVDSATFHRNLKIILDEVQKVLPDKKNLVLLTIPDFSATPEGKSYGNGRDISKGIAEFNAIIMQEAASRKLVCADVYPASQLMSSHPDLVSRDGLHPSAKEYVVWESIIYPLARNLLK